MGASRIGRLLLAVALGTLVPVAAPAAAGAAPCAAPAGVYRDSVTWARRLTDPTRVWPLTNGAGQLVAVLGTGVDASHPQFAPGQVVTGSDTGDCDGRGTFAAGIVAARPDPATTFTGLAPGARVLALRYTENTGTGTGPDPNALAAALRRAVAAGADVVLVVVPTTATSPGLTAAVRAAVAAGVVVVSPVSGDQAGARSYPAGLPGVIGVGAHDRDGAPVQEESGDQVTIAAPGDDLVSTAAGGRGRVGHRWGVRNPAFAAAYVAGAVVLVRAYRPALGPDQVRARLVATANRTPGGGHDPRLGWGVLDVQAAVTAELAQERYPVVPAAAAPAAVVPAAAPPRPPDRPRLPGAVALLGLAAAALCVVGATVVARWTRGARR